MLILVITVTEGSKSSMADRGRGVASAVGYK